MKRKLLSLFIVAALAWSGRAAEEPAKQAKTVRLLTVGNSFARNATQYLGDLAKASGNVLVLHQASIGGGTLEQHWVKAEQHENDPKDPRGLYATKLSLKQELLAEPWDFVTIQQASVRSHDIATYRPFARQLHDYIKKYALKAEVLVHQTWEYRSDDPRFTKPPAKPGEPPTQQAMYESLTSAYEAIAAELGARIIPVGDAFHLAGNDTAWAYKPDANFDAKTAAQPALPVQTHSLHNGWQWKKQKDGKIKLSMDGHHASAAGQYLGACVFFEFLFGENVVGNAFAPKGVPPADAQYLQETAHKAVETRRARQAAN